MELAQGDDPTVPVHADPTQASSSHAANKPLSSSRSMLPSLKLVPLAPVQNLEAQIATLLHDIHPWMKNSIEEAEDLIEKWVAKQAKK